MDAATGLQPLTSHPIVDQRDRKRRDPEAFRRALRQQDEPGTEADAAPETPTRTALQQRAPADRRDEGPHHVDVLV